MQFSKYQGAGNDFIIIDNRNGEFVLEEPGFIRRLCDRHFGIGADGVLCIEKDFVLRIFNADASEPAMCGNGIRCAFDFLSRLLKCSQMQLSVAGRSYACRKEGDSVAVHLGTPTVVHWPILLEARELHVVNTGVPHALLFVEDLEGLNVAEQGRRVRMAPAFMPEGVNATFVRVDSKATISVRTYERGVEAETLSCGSGAAAAAWAARRLYGLEDRIAVSTRSSSTLFFSFTGDEIEMIGPAHLVFSGAIHCVC